MDYEIDLRIGVRSIPVALGPYRAVLVSRIFHLFSALLFAASSLIHNLGVAGLAGVAAASLLLYYQHYLISRRGLDAIPEAFNTNLGLGLILGLAVLADYAIGHFGSIFLT